MQFLVLTALGDFSAFPLEGGLNFTLYMNCLWSLSEFSVELTVYQGQLHLVTFLRGHFSADLCVPRVCIHGSTQGGMIGTVYPNIPLSSASIHGHPRSSLGATLGVRMSATAYGNHSTMSSVWPIGTSRLNLRPRAPPI